MNRQNKSKAQNDEEQDQDPEVYAVQWQQGKARITRRDLLKAGGILAAGTVVAGCSPKAEKTPAATETPTPTPTVTPEPTLPVLDWNCSGAKAHNTKVSWLEFTPDSRSMMSFGDEEVVLKLWSFPDSTQCKILEGHQGNVQSLIVDPKGEYAYSVDQEGRLIAWSLPDGSVFTTFEESGYLGEFLKLSISPDGSKLINSGDSSLFSVWSVPDGTLLYQLDHPDTSWLDFRFSPDNRYLVSFSYDSIPRLWSLDDGQLLSDSFGHFDRWLPPAFSGDNRYLILPTGDSQSEIGLYTLPEAQLEKTLVGHQEKIVTNELLEEASQLITADDQGVLKLWSIPDGTLLTTWEVPGAKFAAYFAVSEEAKIVAAVDNQVRKVYLWSLPDGEEIAQLPFDEGYGTPEFSPDGRALHIITRDYSRDGDTLQIYSVDDLFNPINETIFDAHIVLRGSPDSRFVVVGDEQGTIRLFSLKDGKEVACMVDLQASSEDFEGIEYSLDVGGETVTYTLPCGSPIPAGAVCVCNCVAGSGCACVGHTTCSCVGYSPCSCVSHSSGCSAVYHYWYPN